MPYRAQWEPDFGAGHEPIDAQHRALLTQCNDLADLLAGGGSDDGDRRFDQAFEQLQSMVREHFEAEASVLAGLDDPQIDDHRIEREEFEALAAEIITTEHFERLELQRFVALWCIGHVKGSAAHLRALLAGPGGLGAAQPPAVGSR
jgi:hemerythrin-like metal-binding protein